MILLVDHYRDGVVVAEEDCPALLGADEIRTDKMALDHRDPDSVRYLVEVDAVEPDIAVFERFFHLVRDLAGFIGRQTDRERIIPKIPRQSYSGRYYSFTHDHPSASFISSRS